MFSKACEYAIRATLFIATRSLNGERVSFKEIAREIEGPEAFTAKVLQQLVRQKIVDSRKGVSGGFYLEKKAIDQTSLAQVVRAIDGDSVFEGCAVGLKVCSASRPCPVHDKFSKIRQELKEMLDGTSIYEMATGLEVGLTFLKR